MGEKIFKGLFFILGFYLIVHILYTIYMLITQPLSGILWLIILSIELLIMALAYKKGFIITVPFVICLIIQSIFSGYIYFSSIDINTKNADYALVLGYELKNNVMSKTLQYRLDKAYDYAIDNPDTKLVLCGGITGHNSISEAEVMSRYLSDKGISEDRLLLEDKSTDTIQNIVNSLSYIDLDSNIIVISSQYHTYRAKLICEKVGLNVKAIGAKAPILLIPNQLLYEKLGLIKMLFM